MKDIFELDLLTLDTLWLEQPQLVAQHGRELANAKDKLERSKAGLDVARAEVENMITADPEKFGLAKTTVSAINAAVEVHPDITSARDRLFKNKHKVDLLQALMTALDHRKRALEGLVSLHGQQYFASPRLDENGRKAVTDQTRRSVKERIARRKAQRDQA